MTEGELQIDKCKQGISTFTCKKFSQKEKDEVLRICQKEPKELDIEILLGAKKKLNEKCISCDDFRPK